jgi:outer membrane immunogenic protein
MKYLLTAVALFASSLACAQNFSGPYLGAYAGYAWAEDKGEGYDQFDGLKNGWTVKTRPRSSQYGVLGGYNWTLGDNLLLGVEADYEDRANSRDHDYFAEEGAIDRDYGASTEFESAGSLRGRIGYVVNDQALIYATAGYAVASVKRTWHDYYESPSLHESHSDRQEGWTAGIGAEFLVTQTVSARLEYRHSDYGTENVAADMWGEDYKQRLTEDSVRAGVAILF